MPLTEFIAQQTSSSDRYVFIMIISLIINKFELKVKLNKQWSENDGILYSVVSQFEFFTS